MSNPSGSLSMGSGDGFRRWAQAMGSRDWCLHDL